MEISKFVKNDVDLDAREKEIKEIQAKRIVLLKEKIKGLELAYKTDMFTIPVTQVDLEDIVGVNTFPAKNYCELEKIDMLSPIILGREKNVISGYYQYYNAKDKGLKTINAVYVDSLKSKYISTDTLKKQFKNKNICLSIAYSLYSLFLDIEYEIPYAEFCENFEEIFDREELGFAIYEYIFHLDEYTIG